MTLTFFFCSYKSLKSLVNTSNVELMKVSKWFKCNKLSLNNQKTHFMYFKHSNIHVNNNPISINIDNNTIDEKKSSKFLGVIIDDNLTWNDHRNHVTLYFSRCGNHS